MGALFESLNKALFSNFVVFIKKYGGYTCLHIKIGHFFKKRAANFIRRYKITYFYVKIGLWILTTNFTK